MSAMPWLAVVFTALAAASPACGSPRAGAPQPIATESPAGGDRPCTREAKICPDGSAVGRTGPDCSFAPCPADGTAPASTIDAQPPPPSAGQPAPAASGGAVPPRDRPCPPPARCTGPRMLAPNTLCDDGKSQSGPACVDIGGGRCAWRMLSCPP